MMLGRVMAITVAASFTAAPPRVMGQHLHCWSVGFDLDQSTDISYQARSIAVEAPAGGERLIDLFLGTNEEMHANAFSIAAFYRSPA